MIYDIDLLRRFYAEYPGRVAGIRRSLRRPLTFTEKVLYTHLYTPALLCDLHRGTDYADFRPDRVAMQDATAQMAMLQFMNAGRDSSAVPATIHCDHLIRADRGAEADLATARAENGEVYTFLRQAAARYGVGFWPAGSGIIHQVVLENYAFPGGLMVGTDSHTPNAGGLSMMAIGVGGADAVDVMAGMEWELKMPRIIGVRLSGRLSGWASPKDVILHLAGQLTVKGATNAVIEYFGEGVESLSCTGRATICNMGAEVGATCSVFPFDDAAARYLRATGRKEVAEMAEACAEELRADPEIPGDAEKYYDRIIDIDLSALVPYVNGPFTPDAAFPITEMEHRVAKEDLPQRVEAVLIGSCTNSSYEDLMRAASVVNEAEKLGLRPMAELIINPGSERIRATAERDGLLDTFRRAGAVIMQNACGPCIGQWKRHTTDPARRNSIITTFNRNFAKRADGNPNTFAFITSPEVAAAYAFTGRLDLHPAAGNVPAWQTRPEGEELPLKGFSDHDAGYIAPAPDAPEPEIHPDSERLQRLTPFAPWNGKDFQALPLLIKAKGKCTTDHISPAGPWLRFRGHLENISRNLLSGAVNAFTGRTNEVRDLTNNATVTVAEAAAHYRDTTEGCVVVAEENYGEGSSREHAAMEPRFLGVKAIIAKSFARIHETNLKKQGVLALTFADPADYDLVREGDRFSIRLNNLAPGSMVDVEIRHDDGTARHFLARHSYNEGQLVWFRAGSALGGLRNT